MSAIRTHSSSMAIKSGKTLNLTAPVQKKRNGALRPHGCCLHLGLGVVKVKARKHAYIAKIIGGLIMNLLVG